MWQRLGRETVQDRDEQRREGLRARKRFKTEQQRRESLWAGKRLNTGTREHSRRHMRPASRQPTRSRRHMRPAASGRRHRIPQARPTRRRKAHKRLRLLRSASEKLAAHARGAQGRRPGPGEAARFPAGRSGSGRPLPRRAKRCQRGSSRVLGD